MRCRDVLAEESDQADTLAPVPDTSRPVLVLSLDGGGIRGHFQARVLKFMRDQLATKLGCPDLELRDIFDVIAGTSTGGILACGLVTSQGCLGTSSPIGRTAMLADLYEEHGRDIFAQRLRRLPRHLVRSKYSAEALESILSRYLGPGMTLGDVGDSECSARLLVPAYDVHARRIRWFDSHDWRSSTDPPISTPLWEVARATSAAPTFFGPAQVSTMPKDGPWIDGGVGANDPSGYAALSGLTRLMALRAGAHDIGASDPGARYPYVRVVSIGNTRVRRSRALQAVAGSRAGVFPWLPFLPGLLMHAHAGAASEVLRQFRALVDVPADPSTPVRKGVMRIHRILPPESAAKSVGLDSATQRSLDILSDSAATTIAGSRRFDPNTPTAAVECLAEDLSQRRSFSTPDHRRSDGS